MDTKNIYQKIITAFQNIQAMIALLGIIANVITFCVFSRKRLSKASYSVYYRSVTILDCILLAHSFKYWIRCIFDLDLDVFSPLFCKLKDYFAHVSALSSLSLMTVILIDRLIIILYYNQTQMLKKRWFQFFIVTTCVLCCSILYSLMPLNKQLVELKSHTNSTIPIIKVCYLSNEIKNMKGLIAFGILLFNLLVNVGLYVTLIRFVNQSRRKISTRTSKMLMKDIKFAISSTMTTISSFFSKLPFAVSLILSINGNLTREQSDTLYTVSATIAIIGNAVTLFLNLMFNSIFYEEFMSMFGRTRIKTRNSLVSLPLA